MKEIYLVKLSKVDESPYYYPIIFATTNKKMAKKYCTRFNQLLKKWKKYYSQFEEDRFGIIWVKDEYIDSKFT